MTRPRGPRLASKLLLTSVALLIIPWLGLKTLQATRDFLLQGQAQAQALSAAAVANLFHNRSELFALDTSANDGEAELPLYRLESRIILDGLDEDWDLLVHQRQQLMGEHGDLEFVLGSRDGRLHGLLQVSDDSIVNRQPTQRELNRSDHVRLFYLDTAGTTQRIALTFEGSGQASAYVTDQHWRYPIDSAPLSLLRAYVERNTKGYLVEFSLPLSWLGEPRRFGIAVANAENVGSVKLVEIVRSYPASNSHPNPLVERSVETDRLLQALTPQNSRIWIVDAAGHVKASRGQLEAPPTDSANQYSPGLIDTLYNWLSHSLMGIPLGPTRDFDPDLTATRADSLLRQALAGNPGVEQRSATQGSGEIIAAAHPIYSAGKIMGAVLVEKSTSQVLGLHRRSIERLALLSLFAILVVAIALLGFAARLTLRIRRLDRDTDRAIDRYGRLSTKRIPHELNASDEIGDLARSFNSMLDKLHEHQNFLAAIPNTLRHEINNPLNTISTSLEQLEQGSGTKSNQHLDAARRALRRIHLLVEKLGEAASLEQALESESSQRFDLSALLRDYVRNRMRRPPKPKIKLAVTSEPLIILGSDLHIEQLLDKLIDNAIDFAEPGSPIDITLQQLEDNYQLRIENHGPGIAESRLSSIFELMHSQRESGMGSGHLGLGLYVARLIAEHHGGRIYASNRVDTSGVIFTVELPLPGSQTPT